MNKISSHYLNGNLLQNKKKTFCCDWLKFEIKSAEFRIVFKYLNLYRLKITNQTERDCVYLTLFFILYEKQLWNLKDWVAQWFCDEVALQWSWVRFLLFSSPEPKVQVTFSDHNLSVCVVFSTTTAPISTKLALGFRGFNWRAPPFSKGR